MAKKEKEQHVAVFWLYFFVFFSVYSTSKHCLNSFKEKQYWFDCSLFFVEGVRLRVRVWVLANLILDEMAQFCCQSEAYGGIRITKSILI